MGRRSCRSVPPCPSWGFVAQYRFTRVIAHSWSSGAAGAQVPYKHKVGGSNPSSTTMNFRRPPLVFSGGLFVFSLFGAPRVCESSANHRRLSGDRFPTKSLHPAFGF